MSDPQPIPEPIAQVAPAAAPSPFGLEEAKELLSTRGRERGFVTGEEVLESLPVEDINPEQLEDILARIEEHLRQEGIEVVEAPADDFELEPEPTAIRLPREDDVLRAPTNDPVRMYLK